ncbi:MAG: hypothetical protein GY909_05290 [Oligoflexia bacterium]|nr:hypothetical protein [Oligoflexia bacterium]
MKKLIYAFTIFFLSISTFSKTDVFEVNGKFTFIDSREKEYELRGGEVIKNNGVLFGEGENVGLSLSNFISLSMSGSSFLEVKDFENLVYELKVGNLKINNLEKKKITIKTKVGELVVDSGVTFLDCRTLECHVMLLHGKTKLNETELKPLRIYSFSWNDKKGITLKDINFIENVDQYKSATYFKDVNRALYKEKYDFSKNEYRISQNKRLFEEVRKPASIEDELNADRKMEAKKIIVHELILDSLRVGIEREIVRMISKKAYEVAQDKAPQIISEIMPEILIEKTYGIGKSVMFSEVDMAVKRSLEDYVKNEEDRIDANVATFSAQEIAFVRTNRGVFEGRKQLSKASEEVIRKDIIDYLAPEVFKEVKDYSYSFGVKKGAEILASTLKTSGLKYKPEMKLAVLELSKRYSDLHAKIQSMNQSKKYLNEIAPTVSYELVNSSLKKFAAHFSKKAKLLAKSKSKVELEKLNKREIASDVSDDLRGKQIRNSRNQDFNMINRTIGKPQ